MSSNADELLWRCVMDGRGAIIRDYNCLGYQLTVILAIGLFYSYIEAVGAM